MLIIMRSTRFFVEEFSWLRTEIEAVLIIESGLVIDEMIGDGNLLDKANPIQLSLDRGKRLLAIRLSQPEIRVGLFVRESNHLP